MPQVQGHRCLSLGRGREWPLSALRPVPQLRRHWPTDRGRHPAQRSVQPAQDRPHDVRGVLTKNWGQAPRQRPCPWTTPNLEGLPMPKCIDQPVRCYRNVVIMAFRNTARAAFSEVCKMGLMPDWKQECDLAAWQAEQSAMPLNDAVRFASRSCYRFLRNAGFRKPSNGKGLRR